MHDPLDGLTGREELGRAPRLGHGRQREREDPCLPEDAPAGPGPAEGEGHGQQQGPLLHERPRTPVGPDERRHRALRQHPGDPQVRDLELQRADHPHDGDQGPFLPGLPDPRAVRMVDREKRGDRRRPGDEPDAHLLDRRVPGAGRPGTRGKAAEGAAGPGHHHRRDAGTPDLPGDLGGPARADALGDHPLLGPDTVPRDPEPAQPGHVLRPDQEPHRPLFHAAGAEDGRRRDTLRLCDRGGLFGRQRDLHPAERDRRRPGVEADQEGGGPPRGDPAGRAVRVHHPGPAASHREFLLEHLPDHQGIRQPGQELHRVTRKMPGPLLHGPDGDDE